MSTSTAKNFFSIDRERIPLNLFFMVLAVNVVIVSGGVYFEFQPLNQVEITEQVDSFVQGYSSEGERKTARLCLREAMTSPTSPYVKDGDFKRFNLRNAQELCEDLIFKKRKDAFGARLEGLSKPDRN